MKIAHPDDITTLMLNKNWQAFSICTARAALRHLISGSVKGIDANHNVKSWDDGDISWVHQNMAYYEDQPCLRTVHDVWAVPTVVLCNYYYGYKPRIGVGKITIRKLYQVYGGICQICLKKKPIKQMTKEHVYPKSKGGVADDTNIILTCKPCNHKKGDVFPYHDVEGRELKPKPFINANLPHHQSQYYRKEWDFYLCK